MSNADAPITWLDVARRISKPDARNSARHNGLSRARVSWFGLSLESTQVVEDTTVAKWLEELFPSRLQYAPLRLTLEGPHPNAELPVEINTASLESVYRPSFGIVDGAIEFSISGPPAHPPRSLPIAAALGVKGGTGRTACAIALAIRWAEKSGAPVLLVDADLDAPGVSYLFRAEVGEAKISLEDLIALAHSDEDVAATRTVEYAAERLRDHLMRDRVFILPVRRDLDELASSSIRPEHLSTQDRPYALADILAKIAEKLDCVGVVVDVRAGLVPVGVNMAMDGDVSPMIVTTLSDQALKATGAFARFLNREMRLVGTELRRPLFVVNRVPNTYRILGVDDNLVKSLTDDLTNIFVGDEGLELSSSQGIFDNSDGLDPYTLVKVPEFNDLQVSTAGWSTYLEQMRSSGFISNLNAALDNWIDSELSQNILVDKGVRTDVIPKKNNDELRKQLATFADNLISAENITGTVTKPLVTKPLAALTQRFQSEVPIAVCEGAKGTGKTLAARYFIAQRTWEELSRQLSNWEGVAPALILPVCASIQSSGGYQIQVDQSRTGVSQELALRPPQKISETISWLKEQVLVARTEREWVDVWLDVIAWSAGYNPTESGAGGQFLSFLREKSRSIVAMLEGLEELYTSPAEPGIPTAMRALLIGLPQRLRTEVRRPLGVITFVRSDTVEAAVTQNLDQYRREYASFALTWTESDVLELAAWLVTQAEVLNDVWSSSFGGLPLDEKREKLEGLWGRKLGTDDKPGKRTREAYSAIWVIAVLSDLQGRLVPRDLIRLIANASQIPVGAEEQSTYLGRLLIPRALKAAIEPTSKSKVAETEEEIRELKPIFDKFREHAETVSVPLGQAAVTQLNLSNNELETLKRHGIVLGDTAPYEVPELFRRGLSLRHAGARRSVVNLYRRALQI